ncbi:MAG: serine/threonine-protein kinase [Pseudomonadota bacterium]|nr:serine/threonine-protein kinase [Pseudomonadota bacterium]
MNDTQSLTVGRYRLETILHRGPGSTVYRARHDTLGTPVAVKFFEPAGEVGFDAMQREIATLSRLRHPHTVRILDAGIAPEGGREKAWIALEYLDGPTLRALLNQKGRLDPVFTWTALRQLCDALDEAHCLGIVHRDLKPENVFLVRRGRGGDEAVLADFSIASPGGDSLPSPIVRRSGTPHYMAPELVRGGVPTPASDVYAVGVLAYEAIAGHRPFDGDDVLAVMYRHVHTEAEPLAELVPVDAELARAVHTALSKDPAVRFRDAGELRRALWNLDGASIARHGAFAGPGMDGFVVRDEDLPTLREHPLELFDSGASLPLPRGPRGPRGEGAPRIWILGEDPATSRIVAANLFGGPGSWSHPLAEVEIVPPLLAGARAEELRRGEVPWPAVVIFGGMAVIVEDPLLELFRKQGETARLLVLTHENNELLGMAVSYVGVDAVFVTRGADWGPDLVRSVAELLDRGRHLDRDGTPHLRAGK